MTPEEIRSFFDRLINRVELAQPYVLTNEDMDAQFDKYLRNLVIKGPQMPRGMVIFTGSKGMEEFNKAINSYPATPKESFKYTTINFADPPQRVDGSEVHYLKHP